ncbi:MAG: hypothetical protein GF331_15530 [Chitinivibrionales bacterium]|nr:hypothetical protein [Chitinivibrionales bacterium]
MSLTPTQFSLPFRLLRALRGESHPPDTSRIVCLAIVMTLSCLSAAAATEPVEDDQDVPRFRHCYSLKWTSPQRLSCGITGIICLNKERWSAGPSVSGILLQAEPGIGGLKVALGYGFVSSVRTFTGEDLGLLGHLGIPWLGYAAKVSLLRTAYNPWHVAPGQTYLGLDLQANILLINIDLALLRHIDGNRPNREWLFVWGVGVGF